MPNHWESSARPLFVKTVFVNGNRHAILFEKDPLLPCGNSPSKKISRSNSSLSFDSDLSSSSTESQISNLESKTSKLRRIGQHQRKDLSSDLQSCLVKLKLASGNLESKNSSCEEKCFYNSKELKTGQSTEKGDLKQKKQNWNYNKTYTKLNEDHFYEKSKEEKLTAFSGRKNNRHSSCYVYNLENNKGKRNYCFVKISSQPSQFILNCSCENSWSETHNCDHSSKNNLVISATIHNLVMTSNGSENVFENTLDYVFENSQLQWNNYLTRSYYNSLSERVFQWLDLARKRKKQKETSNITDGDDNSLNSIERIFSGKTFADEIKKTEYSCKSGNKILINKKMGKNMQSETCEEDIEREVAGEPNIETVISTEAINFRENPEDVHSFPRDFNKYVRGNSEPQNFQNNKNFEMISVQNASNLPSTKYLKESITNDSNYPVSNLIKSSLKIQDLFFNSDSNENYSFRDQNKKKIKETHNASTHRNKYKETETSEDDSTTGALHWEKKKRKKNMFTEKSDSCSKQAHCRCNKNLHEYADKIKSHTLSEEFAVKNQKSINNLNIMRTRPVLIQNLLSPQQQSKLTYLQEEKIVWASEKNTGRPQLHIFLPNLQLRDQTDDSMSECENFLNM